MNKDTLAVLRKVGRLQVLIVNGYYQSEGEITPDLLQLEKKQAELIGVYKQMKKQEEL